MYSLAVMFTSAFEFPEHNAAGCSKQFMMPMLLETKSSNKVWSALLGQCNRRGEERKLTGLELRVGPGCNLAGVLLAVAGKFS